jgi:hypothetical protein
MGNVSAEPQAGSAISERCLGERARLLLRSAPFTPLDLALPALRTGHSQLPLNTPQSPAHAGPK